MSTDLYDTSEQTNAGGRGADAAWKRMEAGLRRAQEDPAAASVKARPAAKARPESPRTMPESPDGPGERRMRTALVGVAAIIVIIVLASFASHLLHPAPAATSDRSSTSTPTAPAAPQATSTDIARLESATNDAVSATTAERTGFTVLHGIPTIASTAAVTNPYVDSLQLYATVLAATPVPSSATKAAATVTSMVHEDIAYLEGVNTVAPVHLGTFLQGVFARAVAMQTAMGALEHSLRPPIGS
jgi:hypothetical protein